MTSRTPAELAVQGVQRPRVSSVPECVTSTGAEAVALARRCGLFLDPWQEYVLAESLGERLDGKWAAPDIGLVVPRQNGKGSILAARELAGLFLIEEEVIIHSAHEQATASEQFRRLLNLIESVPEFEQRILKTPKGKGNEAIELRGGQRVFFKTRTSGGGRGFSCDCLIYDEAMFLPESFVAATSPTLAARSLMTPTGVQTWYTGSAVDQQDNEHGVSFARIREQGLAAAPGLAYFEWSIEGDDPSNLERSVLEDPWNWALANPGLGIRIAEEYVARELGKLGARGFAVERLSIGDWPSTDDHAARVIDLAKWDALALDRSEVTAPVFLAFDVTPDRSSASIGAGTLRADGKVHLEVVEHGPGTGWVAGSLATRIDALGDFELGNVICDAGGPAASLVTEVEDELGREVTKVSAKEHADAFGLFCDGVEQSTLVHLGDPDLRLAIDGAVKRPLGEAFAWGRKLSSVDISPLVACTLALWGVRTGEPLYATVLFPEEAPETTEEAEARGPRPPKVLSQADTTAGPLPCGHHRLDGCSCAR